MDSATNVSTPPPPKCRKCAVALVVGENWYPYHARRAHRELICRTCFNVSLRPYIRRRGRLATTAVFLHYGGSPPRCANPYGLHDTPFTVEECLTLDHVDGSGHLERRGGSRGRGLIHRLIADGFPAGFQILCFNCQWLKAFRRGETNGSGRKVWTHAEAAQP